MERPFNTLTNHHYVSNGLPLQPRALIPLPVRSVQPRGWLRVMLERQREGLTGHLGEISSWLQKQDNAWPDFNKHLCAAIYSASEVTATAGAGTKVKIATGTHYPFEETIRFTVKPENAVTFPLYLRIPAWCRAPQVSLNGKRIAVKAAAGKYVRLEREWHGRETVTLELPMDVSLRQWARNNGSVSVDYGPLTFSLKIRECYERHDSTKTAIGDSSWRTGADPSKWPAHEIHPTTPWNGMACAPGCRPARRSQRNRSKPSR